MMENLPQRDYQAITVRREGALLYVTLNRPERRNALTPRMIGELLVVLEDAQACSDLKVLIISGAGKGFCSGADLLQMSGSGEGSDFEKKGGYPELLLALCNTTLPVVAAVNGHAMGGGLGLVAAATFAMARADAKLGTPEIKVGLFPFMIASVIEPIVGRRAMLEMMLLGKPLSAERGAELGLVREVIEAGQFDAKVRAFATSLARQSGSAVRLGLSALRDTEGLSLADKLPILQQRLVECLASDDAQEGLRAFMEKREPQWK